MNRCPGCGFNAQAGWTSSHFYVFTCSKCRHKYCYQCRGSNGGNKCPECGSTGYSDKEKVWLK